jgi:hypothetical protein
MGLGDEYSRDALFRRPDQEVADADSDFEEHEEPLHPEDWESLMSDEIYTDIVLVQEFVYDGFHRIKLRYGVAEYTRLLNRSDMFWVDEPIRIDVMRFQGWLKNFIDLY